MIHTQFTALQSRYFYVYSQIRKFQFREVKPSFQNHTAVEGEAPRFEFLKSGYILTQRQRVLNILPRRHAYKDTGQTKQKQINNKQVKKPHFSVVQGFI